MGTFEIDPIHTFVTFRAQHLVVGRVRGRFEAVRGTIVVAKDLTESSVEVTVATASVSTMNPMSDEDLRWRFKRPVRLVRTDDAPSRRDDRVSNDPAHAVSHAPEDRFSRVGAAGRGH
ncbi:YceI family protein [Sinomonas sp. ASV486]|uniref:YceI family protein n=1 Tax=Sinomonas sp. ASV486 TaxID=3051170 RepID=UPI0027DAF8B2|nr:YceI family protein [Sinomonas sp. ASV486]MDQ4491217.1 YceI family protein [Sinomonas sp. ASV486]